MAWTRRDLVWLLPALAVPAGFGKEKRSLASKVYAFEDLPVNSNGKNSFRAVLEGRMHAGCTLEVHETDLAPGELPHPAHHHLHEEMFLIREGTIEVTINGRSQKVGPGGVAFIASGDEHGIRNAGHTHAQYFVIGLGSDDG
jgi:mannose-6-phosphate isomerase-like protein (cupin superfamily)